MASGVEFRAEPHFVGRSSELAVLTEGLERAGNGTGECWLIRGPGGIGKTTLMRQLQTVGAQDLGFEVHWAYAMPNLPTPFFLMDQLFRSKPPSENRSADVTSSTLPTLLFVEEKRPTKLFHISQRVSRTGEDVLIVSRESPLKLKEEFPTLLAEAKMLWLTRTEGEGHISPSDIDGLGERIVNHVTSTKERGAVVLTGLDYLITHNSFLPTLRLIQLVRDTVEESGGHLLIALHPGTLEDRERALMISEGEVLSEATESVPPLSVPQAEAPSLHVLKYLDQLEQMARRSPQLLFVDDIQWADALSAQALSLFTRHLQRLPVMLVASERKDPGEGSTSLQVDEMLDRLQHEGALGKIDLTGLTTKEVEALVKHWSAGVAPGQVSLFEKLRSETAGNPYFVTELVHQALDGPSGVGRPAGLEASFNQVFNENARAFGSKPVTIPESIRNLVNLRLKRLSADDSRLLRTAALLGSTFEIAALDALPEYTKEGGTLSTLMSIGKVHRLVEPVPHKPGYWTFAHPFVWDVVISVTPPEERRGDSRRLADWLAANRPNEIEVVAHLYHEAGAKDPGLKWTRMASENSKRMLAGESMVTFVQWSLDLLGDSAESERAEMEFALAQAHIVAGSIEPALKALRKIYNSHPSGPLHWKARLEEASSLVEIRPAEAKEAIERLKGDADRQKDAVPSEVMADILITASDSEMLNGDASKGAAFAREAISMLGKDGDPRLLSLALDHLGWSLFKLGDMDEALGSFQKGGQVSEASGQFALKAWHLDGEASVRHFRGDLVGASQLVKDASTLSRSLGDYVNASIHLVNLSTVLRDLGEREAAAARLKESLRMADRFDITRSKANAYVWLGRLAYDDGKFEDAEEYLLRSRKLAQSSGREQISRLTETLISLIRGERGDPSGAFASLPPLDESRKPLEARVRARLLQLLSRHAQAAECLKAALDGAQESGVSSVEIAELKVLLGRTLAANGQKEAGSKIELEGVEALRRSGRRDPSWVPWI